jgi:acetyl-CoA C-acetyltransferase
MVSGVGMHLTKHVYAVYSTEPGRRPPRPPDAAATKAALGAGTTRVIRDVAAGSAEVATYSVAHGRDGGAEWGLAVCDLPEGERCYARIEDADLLAQMEATEWIGATVDLVPGAGNVNLVKP